MSILVVAATEVEARYFTDRERVLLTGPGKTAAAAATAATLARTPDPSGLLVVNVGTAGALRDGITGIVVPHEVIVHDLSADAIRALGVDVVDRIRLDGNRASGHILATGDQFIESEATRLDLARHAHIVDMEGFAVAYAAQAAGARVMCVKHVSDQAGDTARLDWAAAVDRSAQLLADWVRTNL